MLAKKVFIFFFFCNRYEKIPKSNKKILADEIGHKCGWHYIIMYSLMFKVIFINSDKSLLPKITTWSKAMLSSKII